MCRRGGSTCVQEGREPMAPADRGSACIVIHYIKVNTHRRGTLRAYRGTLAGGEEIRVPLACT